LLTKLDDSTTPREDSPGNSKARLQNATPTDVIRKRVLLVILVDVSPDAIKQ
jgi:hypothetical protein